MTEFKTCAGEDCESCEFVNEHCAKVRAEAEAKILKEQDEYNRLHEEFVDYTAKAERKQKDTEALYNALAQTNRERGERIAELEAEIDRLDKLRCVYTTCPNRGQ